MNNFSMNRTLIFPMLFSLVCLCGCSISESSKPEANSYQFDRAEGDKTIYALAADNTSDSILVFLTLPYSGGDPDTLNILKTRRERQLFGRTNTGDQLAILRDEEDTTAAAMVIVVEDFLGQWCYEVFPTLRRHIPDSIMPARIRAMLDKSREYSMTMKTDNVMYNMGARLNKDSLDDVLPVVYPKPKRYTKWAIYNGKLVLTETAADSTMKSPIVSTDTAEFVRLRRDTLILRFADGEHMYYKKVKSEK